MTQELAVAAAVLAALEALAVVHRFKAAAVVAALVVLAVLDPLVVEVMAVAAARAVPGQQEYLVVDGVLLLRSPILYF